LEFDTFDKVIIGVAAQSIISLLLDAYFGNNIDPFFFTM